MFHEVKLVLIFLLPIFLPLLTSIFLFLNKKLFNELVTNFLVGYVGQGKIIQNVKRNDVIFHVKRALQEFSYDTLPSIKSQEATIPPNLSIPIPQDYVNYVKMSWVDQLGVKHIIYPTTLTSNPDSLLPQDFQGIPLQDNFSEDLDVFFT